MVFFSHPSEKYESNWIISPSRGEIKKYLKLPPRHDLTGLFCSIGSGMTGIFTYMDG